MKMWRQLHHTSMRHGYDSTRLTRAKLTWKGERHGIFCMTWSEKDGHTFRPWFFLLTYATLMTVGHIIYCAFAKYFSHIIIVIIESILIYPGIQSFDAYWCWINKLPRCTSSNRISFRNPLTHAVPYTSKYIPLNGLIIYRLENYEQ